MNAYEERKAARIERLKARSEKKKAQGEALLSQASNMASIIPMGQPILVGHHSERADRRYRDRIHNKTGKGCEALDQAKELEQRAGNAEERTAIDSDNPEAQNLLAEKLTKLETYHAKMKTFNKEAKKLGLKETLKKYPEFIEAFKYCPWAGDKLPSFYLTNNGAEIRRLKLRQEQLKSMATIDRNFEVKGIEVSEQDGRLIVSFPGKPNDASREKLKRSPLALKWSRFNGAWVRKITPSLGQRYMAELRTVLEAVEYE